MPRPEDAENGLFAKTPRLDGDNEIEDTHLNASWFEAQLSKFAGRLERQLVQANGKLDDLLRSATCYKNQTNTLSYEEAESIRPRMPISKEYVQRLGKKLGTDTLDGIPQEFDVQVIPRDAKLDVEIGEVHDEHYVYSEHVLQSWERVYEGVKVNEVSKLGPARDGETSYFLHRLLEDTRCAGIVADTGFTRFLTFRPTSTGRIFWEFIGLGAVLYDIIAIPFMLAFDLTDSPFTQSVDIITLVYWIVDTISGFFVGFYERDLLVLKLRRTAWNYLRGTFVLDVTIVLLDTFLMISSSGSTQVFGTARVVKLGKAAKIVRSLRSIRMLRLKRSTEVFEQLISSSGTELAFILMKFARLIAVVLLVVHVIACVWWSLGCSDDHTSWVAVNHMLSEDLGYKYSTSLHWAITQFTPASMEMVPTNAYERFFAILIVLFGMVAFSSCISSITGYMIQLSNYGGAEREREKQLRMFLGEHKISFGLTQQIWQFLRAQKPNRKLRKHEDGIELLRLIPDVLRLELHGELYIPTLVKHPLFRSLAVREAATMQYLCSVAMTNDTRLTGRDYFSKGDAAKNMIFLHSGCMMYSLLQIQADMTNAGRIGSADYAIARALPGASGAWSMWSHKRKKSIISRTTEFYHKQIPYCYRLEEGAWLSEASLWITGWTHCGWLVSTQNVELFLLSAEKFHNYFSTHSARSCIAVCRYGAYYNAAAVSKGVWKYAGLTDLSLPFSELDDMATKSFSKLHALEGEKFQRHQGIGLRDLFDMALDAFGKNENH